MWLRRSGFLAANALSTARCLCSSQYYRRLQARKYPASSQGEKASQAIPATNFSLSWASCCRYLRAIDDGRVGWRRVAGGGERKRGSEEREVDVGKRESGRVEAGRWGQNPKLNCIWVFGIFGCQQSDGSARKAQNHARKRVVRCRCSRLLPVFGMLRALSQSDARHRPA